LDHDVYGDPEADHDGDLEDAHPAGASA
jgi:hypothetical protein